jgi:predicted ATPase/DNA-binding SARP family transcriptional activator/DNA-binding NarL/FixJ family response regulator
MLRFHRSAAAQPVAEPKGVGREPEVVRISLLGGFRVSVGSRTIEEGEWHLKKAQSLIKLLALAPRHRLHREQAMNLLWPEQLDQKAAANNLHQALHFARRALEPEAVTASNSHLLRLHGELLELCSNEALQVDVEAFEEATANARRLREPAAYRAAVALYTGELLPGDRYEDWAEERREGLRLSYLGMLVEMAGLYEERGNVRAAIEAFREAVAAEPTHEEAQQGLMRLYAGTGQRHQALRQYEQLGQALGRELDAQPDTESRRLHEEILAGRTPTPAVAPRPASPPLAELPDAAGRHNLPDALTSFVGREREVVEVERLSGAARLLTLTGAGGSGKTRLALEVARALVGAYPDGVWLVELAPLSERALVPQAVAAALGVREQPNRPLVSTLLHSLREQKVLLVLDNCEHLIGATASLVEALLRSCPRLKILATSREVLGAAGEVSWLAPPLSGPGPRQRPTLESLEEYESVRLFVERARYRDPAFVLTPQNARAVADVCRQLDGIPLAIELAAAQVGVLSVEQISARLEDSLRLLTSGSRTATLRQRTLRRALDWSYDLLSEPERMLFGRLSVFAGGWTLEAAEVVWERSGTDEGDVLDLLSRLVDKSLIVSGGSPESEGALRYRMLEPVRQYAREKLEESGKAEAARQRHSEYYLALAETAEPELTGRNQAKWLDRLEAEHDNLRAALGWSLQRPDVEPGLRLAVAMSMFWHTHGHLSEGRAWLERTISASSTTTDSRTRAKALNGAGWMAMFQGEYEAARALFERALALFRELKDEDGTVLCITNLGLVAVLGERHDIPVPALLEEAMELKPNLTDPHTVANLLILSGLVSFARGDAEQAWKSHEESLAISRETGDAGITIVCLTNLGLMAVGRADHARASALLGENLRLARKADDKVPIQYALFGLAGVAASQRLPVRAARLWGASEAVREAASLHLTALARSGTNYDDLLAATRAQLGEAAFATEWAAGRAMSQEDAIEYALGTEVEPIAAAAPKEPTLGEPPDTLTGREREVAILVARGLTNRQISSELSISERTVHNHVRKILKKLELRSRAQIAAWATERRLHETEPG